MPPAGPATTALAIVGAVLGIGSVPYGVRRLTQPALAPGNASLEAADGGCPLGDLAELPDADASRASCNPQQAVEVAAEASGQRPLGEPAAASKDEAASVHEAPGGIALPRLDDVLDVAWWQQSGGMWIAAVSFDLLLVLACCSWRACRKRAPVPGCGAAQAGPKVIEKSLQPHASAVVAVEWSSQGEATPIRWDRAPSVGTWMITGPTHKLAQAAAAKKWEERRAAEAAKVAPGDGDEGDALPTPMTTPERV